jgi:hypothetical protein
MYLSYGGIASPQIIGPPLNFASIGAPGACVLLESFYFGCAPDLQQGTASLPLACAVTLNGFNAQGAPTGTQTFNFTPNALASDMTKADVNLIKNSRLITFTTSPETGLITLVDSMSCYLFANVDDCKA